MKPPSAEEIRAVPPLTQLKREGDPMDACQLCGLAGGLRVWREHDEHDQPIVGTGALVFIGEDHRYCIARMEAHPRLYREEVGLPGHFPRLCGDCTHRHGLDCAHPSLKKNGGTGLRIMQEGVSVVLCSRDGCHTPLRAAIECVGRERAVWNPETDLP